MWCGKVWIGVDWRGKVRSDEAWRRVAWRGVVWFNQPDGAVSPWFGVHSYTECTFASACYWTHPSSPLGSARLGPSQRTQGDSRRRGPRVRVPTVDITR